MERAQSVAIEEDVPETPPEEAVVTLGDEILDFYQPDEDLKLEDLVPDAHVPTPGQILESPRPPALRQPNAGARA